ncbi:MAG: ATP-binding protein [Thermodesulfobacteriota bacterium]
MNTVTKILGDLQGKIRRIRFRNTIVIPIVLLLLSISAGILTVGYFINKSAFHAVLEERESNKARNIHRTIESIVTTEVDRISSLARILKNDTDIVYGLFHYQGTRGDVKPLVSAMNQVYPKLNLPVFIMSDPNGNILFSAGKGTGKGAWGGKLSELPAFGKALTGQQVVTSFPYPDPENFGIRAIVPVYVFGGNKPAGVMILGNRIDDEFASRIARETGSQVFIATTGKVIAGSYDIALSKAFDPALAKISLERNAPVFRMDKKIYRSHTYVPITIVDERFSLAIETDISVIRELMSKNRAKMMQWGLILLVGIALTGTGLALLLVLPLNGLYEKALRTIREYSGSDTDAGPRENEISTLVRANDVMLETIKNHLEERTRAEAAFKETSHVLHSLIDASPLAVVVSDASGTVRVWNPAAVRMFGWTEPETIGHANPLLCGDGNRELRDKCDLVLHGRKFSNTEIPGRTRDGSEIVLAFSGAPLLDAQGNVSAMMAILADITDAKTAEEALRRSEEQLRQSLKMEAVGKLAGGVAHDFNNLLSVITGYSELLLLRTDEGNPVRREIEEIHKAGERAASLTQQLLAFSRRQVLKPTPLRLDAVVENLGKMLRRLIGEDVDFATETQEDLWMVRADPNQMDQILMNLCVNARDAMPAGGKLVVSTANVTLDAPLAERELTIPPGRYVTLRVSDNGVGMNEEILSRIFEPFFTTKKQGKGTGLGLATVYGIVKQSGGYILVSSSPLEGTAFTVYLPVAEEKEQDAQEERREADDREPEGDKTILLVEDEDMVRELAVEIFKGSGYNVLDAPNGPSALEIVGRHEGRIDLLVTDLVMPGMNGIELAEKVVDARPGTPVLYMSGYAEDAKKLFARMAPGRAFLQKPITPRLLSRKAREVLNAREGASTAGSEGARIAPSL